MANDLASPSGAIGRRITARHRSAAEPVQFAGSYLPQLYLHAVVAQELMAGAIHDRASRQLEKDVIAPFEKRGRVIVPTYRSWKRSGEIVAKLIKARKLPAGGVPRSFMNDAVLAASCREVGVTIVTLNDGDFRRIASVEEVAFESPWPRADHQT